MLFWNPEVRYRVRRSLSSDLSRAACISCKSCVALIEMRELEVRGWGRDHFEMPLGHSPVGTEKKHNKPKSRLADILAEVLERTYSK